MEPLLCFLIRLPYPGRFLLLLLSLLPAGALNARTASLDLGRDTAICSGTSIRLRAGRHFMSYEWQDGSRDSSFRVTAPGRYWVKVIDSSGNSYSDSMTVGETRQFAIPVSPDRVKCNNDTLHFAAPEGYLSYEWVWDREPTVWKSRVVVVNPSVTSYYVFRAQKTAGCYAVDTIHITVHRSPAINLGPDTGLCEGSGLQLDAGPGFVRYEWNNGYSLQRQTVRQTGTYHVTGTNDKGCVSRDTVRVSGVFGNPAVRLDGNGSLCSNGGRTLDPGPFASYEWQDGSASRRYTVQDTGTYYVSVVDENGCRGSDTAVFHTLVPPPVHFLPADTAVCPFGTVELKPAASFRSYSWSNGAIAPSLRVEQPGTYWLEAVDQNGCTGKDTVLVRPKECPDGLNVPTAFTPNGDGRNDRFIPFLFGDVRWFEFTVYNRWGEVLFRTTEAGKGWDGTVSGLHQDSGIYLWTVRYQMEGRAARVGKGTVILIR